VGKVYSEEEMAAIGVNPILLRRWTWRMILHWRWRACKYRRLARRMTTQEGRDHWFGQARLENAMANVVAASRNAWVRSCLEPATCTCSSTRRETV
jgi:hypothetical protein